MDITVKEYEHRHLAMSVCEHECNVGRKYVLPQALDFGLSWGRTVMKKTLTATGWQPPLDPKNKQIVVEALLVAPVPGRVRDFDRLEWPPTERCEDL